MKSSRYFILAALLLCALLCVSVSAAKQTGAVSPALEILASKTDMAKAAPSGGNLTFGQADFMRSLNLSRIDSITVTTLPPAEDGVLTVAGGAVKQGQTVDGKNLDLLCFIPASGKVTKSHFGFSADGGFPVTCHMYFLDKTNYCPTLSLASEASLKVQTHETNSATGVLEGYDPDGDRLCFEIVSYPKNGAVVLSDRESGRFTYTPTAGYTGKDSFEYVARDVYGNYSASATVSVSVNARQTSVVFSDIDDCDIYNAALTMAENSLMTGTASDGVTLFDPNGNISRAEFLMTAMKASGISAPAEGAADQFDDISALPSEMRNYINTACKMGFVTGKETDGGSCFLPNDSITRAEAAVVLSNIITASRSVEKPLVKPVFADSAILPAWAKDAVYNISALGIIRPANGYLSPNATLTRGDAALMLEAMIQMDK